ncbi:hypothetical protein [Candidatus Ichthyocystis sparus]|uniref:hypothetical protein n=1 Tax=Candidatus Ichthyocystis sparus TaxID=1561004 RepID=UPI000B867015|nr:hypothetical protein [Candidatus Ichthyocystis sparus]
MISYKKIVLVVLFFVRCGSSIAVSFENVPWTVSVDGFLNGAFMLSSCDRNLIGRDVIRCPSSLDSWGDYVVTNGLLPSVISFEVSKKEQQMTVGGIFTVRLPVFNGLVDQGDLTVSRSITQNLIFWDSPSSGRFEIGRNYPALGREVFSYNGLLSPVERNFESFSGYRTYLPRSYAVISYRTPVLSNFCAGVSIGDGTELQKLTGNSAQESYLPNMSVHFSYNVDWAHFWFNYFLQSLFNRYNKSSFMVSAGEIGGILGPSRLSGDGVSLIMSYQMGRAMGLLSDFLWPVGYDMKSLPRVSYFVEGIRYVHGRTHFLATYSRTSLFHRTQVSDGWIFSVSQKINSALHLFGQLGFVSWPGLVREQRLCFAGVGFMFSF